MLNTLKMQVVKVDADAKTYKMWYEEGTFASEPVFVPAPNAKVS